MANGAVIGLGIVLFFIAAIAFFWQLDSGYTYPQVHEVCISDIGQLAQYWFGGNQEARETCNHVQMVTYGIYGVGLLGIILIIVGSVVSGTKKAKKEDVEPKQDDDSMEILKKRYAKGEISKKEFENMKKDLV